MYAIIRKDDTIIAVHDNLDVLRYYIESIDLKDHDIVELKKKYVEKNPNVIEDLYLEYSNGHFTQSRYVSIENAYDTTWEFDIAIKTIKSLMYNPNISKKDCKHLRHTLDLLESELESIKSVPQDIDSLKKLEAELCDMRDAINHRY